MANKQTLTKEYKSKVIQKAKIEFGKRVFVSFWIQIMHLRHQAKAIHSIFNERHDIIKESKAREAAAFLI